MTTFLYGLITAVLTAVDLWCKSYIEKNYEKGQEKKILKDKVTLRRVHNKGMALNAGSKYPEAVRVLSGLVCGIVGVYSVFVWTKEQCPWKKLGAACTLSGAISNTYDRFVRKYVVDYFGFQTKWEKFNRVTFNLGDIFIFLGSVILVAAEIVGLKQK